MIEFFVRDYARLQCERALMDSGRLPRTGEDEALNRIQRRLLKRNFELFVEEHRQTASRDGHDYPVSARKGNRLLSTIVTVASRFLTAIGHRADQIFHSK